VVESELEEQQEIDDKVDGPAWSHRGGLSGREADPTNGAKANPVQTVLGRMWDRLAQGRVNFRPVGREPPGQGDIDAAYHAE
jgi:hypothetical protein